MIIAIVVSWIISIGLIVAYIRQYKKLERLKIDFNKQQELSRKYETRLQTIYHDFYKDYYTKNDPIKLLKILHHAHVTGDSKLFKKLINDFGQIRSSQTKNLLNTKGLYESQYKSRTN